MIVEKFYTYCYNCFEGGEKMNIGKIIKERREEIGMSQEELAIKLGYKSRSSINKIERDGRGLPQGKIKAIADALNTTPSHIMGWDIESEETPQKSDASTDILIRMEKDENFSEVVQILYKLESEKLLAVKTMLESFTK